MFPGALRASQGRVRQWYVAEVVECDASSASVKYLGWEDWPIETLPRDRLATCRRCAPRPRTRCCPRRNSRRSSRRRRRRRRCSSARSLGALLRELRYQRRALRVAGGHFDAEGDVRGEPGHKHGRRRGRADGAKVTAWAINEKRDEWAIGGCRPQTHRLRRPGPRVVRSGRPRGERRRRPLRARTATGSPATSGPRMRRGCSHVGPSTSGARSPTWTSWLNGRKLRKLGTGLFDVHPELGAARAEVRLAGRATAACSPRASRRRRAEPGLARRARRCGSRSTAFADASGAIASLEITDVLADQADARRRARGHSASHLLVRARVERGLSPSSRCARWRPVSGRSSFGRRRATAAPTTSAAVASDGAQSRAGAIAAASRSRAAGGGGCRPRPVSLPGSSTGRRFLLCFLLRPLLFLPQAFPRFRSLRSRRARCPRCWRRTRSRCGGDDPCVAAARSKCVNQNLV